MDDQRGYPITKSQPGRLPAHIRAYWLEREIYNARCLFCAEQVVATEAGGSVIVAHGDRVAPLLVHANPSEDAIKYALFNMLRQHHAREAKQVSDG